MSRKPRELAFCSQVRVSLSCRFVKNQDFRVLEPWKDRRIG
jgi:hypothetical protein